MSTSGLQDEGAPITESNATWSVVAPEDPSTGKVYDVHSGANGIGRDGKPFSQW